MNNKLFDKALMKIGKTQKEMAIDLGINPCRISDMKKHRIAGWKYRHRISKYFGVAEETLFPDDGDKNQKSCQM